MADAEKDALKRLALNIVRGQTNAYIKELLRENGVRIGATKVDFDRNLIKAIDDGALTRAVIESWLNQVEGWGQQHVYVYQLSDDLKKAFGTADKAQEQIVRAGLAQYWNKPTSGKADWPADEDLHLVSITYEDSLRFHWYKGTQYWVRTREEEKFDKPIEEIEGFFYQFRAYRGRALREVMRFEIRPQDEMAALFIPQARGSKEHAAANEQAQQMIGKALDWAALERDRMLVGAIIRNFDQELSFQDESDRVASPQTTRLRSGVAYVEFGAVREDGSYLDSADVKKLRGGLRSDDDIAGYQGTSAKFVFKGGLGRVELFDSDDRIKLWSSLTAERVWEILRTLKKFETTGPSK
jgi:hypothetical protein